MGTKKPETETAGICARRKNTLETGRFCVLAIFNMRAMSKEDRMKKKDESIKLRVTKEQKEALKRLSKQNNENMTAYLLRKGMGGDGSVYRLIPDKVDACNFLNEVYHGLVTSGIGKAEQEVRGLFQAALKKYGEDLRK